MDPDAYLQSVVQWASGEQGRSVAITLAVNGAIVTGWVVTEAEYFDGLAKKWEVSSDTLQRFAVKLNHADHGRINACPAALLSGDGAPPIGVG